MRILIKLSFCLFGCAAGLLAAFALLVAFPNWAFAHEAGTERLRVHSTTPLPEETAEWARQVMADLDQGPLPPSQEQYHIYVTQGGWREFLYFLPARNAGGVVYPFNTQATFFSGADFTTNRLIKGEHVITAPRTLSYYGLHEITHLVQMERVGLLRYVRLPNWKREGIADFVALGPTDQTIKDAIDTAAQTGDRLSLMQQHGAYPEYRDAVTRRLNKTTITALLEEVRHE